MHTFEGNGRVARALLPFPLENWPNRGRRKERREKPARKGKDVTRSRLVVACFRYEQPARSMPHRKEENDSTAISLISLFIGPAFFYLSRPSTGRARARVCTRAVRGGFLCNSRGIASSSRNYDFRDSLEISLDVTPRGRNARSFTVTFCNQPRRS